MNAPFNATREACLDVMAARDSAFIAPTEVFLEVLFSGGQHDRHVEAYRGHKWLTGRLAMFRRADIAMRAELGLPPLNQASE